ncbi:MAG: TIGR03084 family metal-binding protein [Hyphomicrobiaceae bacterium]
MKQIDDFRTEVAELAAILAPLQDRDWATPTQFKDYTIADLVRHLHQGDQMALLSAEQPAAFQDLLVERRRRRAAGLSPRDDARRQFGHLDGERLLSEWQSTAVRLADRLAALGPEARLKWAGPDMGVRMFVTARQMEVWAHGQDIYDVLGLDRDPTDRLENIAVIGVRTFGWTFANRGEQVPPLAPHVRLVAPSGAVWQWHEGSTAGSLTGSALAFCQVVTQVRNVADTDLVVRGETAARWMAIAQCFAGPPENPPSPGSRHRIGLR